MSTGCCLNRFPLRDRRSEIEIAGLTRGKQYRFRVRAGKVRPWSDHATRVANI